MRILTLHPKRIAGAVAWLIGLGLTAVLMLSADAASDKDENAVMSDARLEQLIKRLDPEAEGRPGLWQLTVEEREVLVITDEKADRMRIMTGVAQVDELDENRTYRLLQANFDTALDARYAIAKNAVWSVFVHPLGTLRDADFLSGLGQVINLAQAYGTSYSSGLLLFQGGDSGELRQRELIDRLLKRGLEI